MVTAVSAPPTPAVSRDTGCTIATGDGRKLVLPSCLRCPLVLCQYELPSASSDDPDNGRVGHGRYTYNHTIWALALVAFEALLVVRTDEDAAELCGVDNRFGVELRAAAFWIQQALSALHGGTR